MENGKLPVEYSGKSLAEIDINTEYAEEDNNDNGVILFKFLMSFLFFNTRHHKIFYTLDPF